MEARAPTMQHSSTADPTAGESDAKSTDINKLIELLRSTLVNHVENNEVQDLFFDITDPLTKYCRSTQMVTMQFTTILGKLREQDRMSVIYDIIGALEQFREADHKPLQIYERIVDKILYFLGENDLLSEGHLLTSLVMTTDYCLRSSLDPLKWEFISQRWRNIGIKGIRSLFKTFMIFIQKLPLTLSPSQKRQIQPVEDIVIDILDSVPSIFTMTELQQFKSNIFLHAFPRMNERIGQIKAYCRPLADLVFVVGRTFMFPIVGHPLFQATLGSAKVDKNLTLLLGTNYSSRLIYLPNKKELAQPQVYLFHMIMKQPRGKEVLNQMTRVNTHTQTFEAGITMLINETMAAVEALPPKQEIPRYQWEHLLSVVIFIAQHEFQAMTEILRSLRLILAKHKYTRARDEIMWIMLQIMGSFVHNYNKEVCDEMLSLHKLLYPADMKSPTFTSGDEEAPNYAMVRHVSTACMYILQGEKDLKPPSPYLENQIEFLKQRSQENVTDLSIIAMLTNAYRNEAGRRFIQFLQSRLEGSPNDEQFYLPYGRPVNNVLYPMETALIDSLSMRTKMHLLSILSAVFQKPREKMPSPAYFESYCRLFYSLEFDFGVKMFSATISKVASSSQSQGDIYRDYMHIILDLLANRLSNIPTNVHFRQTICLTMISYLHSVSVQGSFARELYSMSEQVLMREFSWVPHTEAIRFCFEFLGKGRNESRSVNAHVGNPEYFSASNNDAKHFHVCPEIVRMLHISLLRAAKIMEKDFTEEPDFLIHIGRVFKWTPKQMRSFPAAFREIPGVIDDSTDCAMDPETFNLCHSDYMQMRGLPNDRFVEYMVMLDRKPTIFCVIYRAIVENQDVSLYSNFYQVLNVMNPRMITVATNWLAEYVIHQISLNQDTVAQVAKVLLLIVFHRYMIPFERVLLSLVLHVSNDAKAKIGMDIIVDMLQSHEWKERMTFYESRVPAKNQRNREFFEGNADFHKQFPEFTYQEMLQTMSGMLPQVNPKLHPVTYYGSLIERLLPITDQILGRFLEMDNTDQELRDLLSCIGPIYKYHPNIFKFVYTVLHTMHGIIHQSLARIFAMALIGMRRPHNSPSSYLTAEFCEFNHQHGPFEAVIENLIQRIIECSEFVLEPPQYVESDWRTAELTAPAQALLMSCIELLASPHHPSKVVPAIIQVLGKSEIVYSRPFATLNAVGLLLTALPSKYAQELHSIFAEVLEQHRVNDLTFEDIVYDHFEESVLLRVTNKEMTINYALQSYWHHANQCNVSQFTSFFIDDIYDKITTENELWYYIRLMLPLQQWMFDSKIRTFYPDCIRLAKGLMDKIGELCQNEVTFVHGPELCDVFYHLKYTCLGDSLQAEAAELLEKLPPNLQKRFKFYVLSKVDDPKVSSVVPPDALKLMKTRSNASD